MLNPDKFPYDLAGAGWQVATSRPLAFAGGTANKRGNDGGTKDPQPLFTVTGDVLVRIWGVCTVDLAGATATLSVGVTGAVAGLIALTTATDIDASEIWNDATPAAGVELLSNVLGPYIIEDGNDIIETVATANITSGQVYYICLWMPLSLDGNVVGLQEV